MSVESELKRQNKLLEEQNRLLRQGQRRDAERAEEERHRRRRAKYNRLLEAGELPTQSLGGVGRGERWGTPSYAQWNGNSAAEDKAERDYWANERR